MNPEPRLTSCGTILVILVLCCTGTTVRSQNVTAVQNIGMTNNSNIWGILNNLDIPSLIGSMQQDGRLVELASIMASSKAADIQMSDECIHDGLRMLQGVVNTNMWALQMLDAIGKPHSGIISDFDINWLGSFDECLGIEAITYSNDTLKSEPVHHFDGKYCRIGLPLPAGLMETIPAASPLKHKRSGELPTRFLKLKDEQDGPCVKLALFGEDALQDYSQGDVLRITDTYRWKTTSTLSTKRSSKIEFMPPESVDVTLDNYNLDTDPDFQEDSNNSSDAQEFSVLGIQTANIYQCCPHTVGQSMFNTSAEYEPDAECQDGEPLSTKAIVAICVLSVLGVFVVIGTLYDISLRLSRQPNTKQPVKNLTSQPHTNGTSLNEEVKVDLSLVSNGNTCGDARSTTNGDLAHENKQPVVVQSVQHGTLEKIFLSFSVYSNGLKILSTNQPKSALTCINGIRFLSMTWVILGHCIDFGAKNGVPFYMTTKVWQWTFYGIFSATVSVDTFFTLSGLLVAYMTLRELSKRGGAKKLNWFMFYFHRYWRLTPAYMLTLMVYATLVRYFVDGPMWPVEDVEGKVCEVNWWANLLYINNFLDVDKLCFGWSWYLSNDMQFYILSPLIVVPFYYNAKLGGVVAFVFLGVTTAVRAVIAKQHEYTAILQGFIGPRPKDADFMQNMYLPAHTRMGPYIVGLVAGYLLYRYKDTLKMKKTWNLLGWFSCMAIIILVIYGVYPDDGNHYLSVDESVAYVTLHRTAWALAVSWIIIACATGHGGWINDLLSWSPFAPLGRLSYCAYLVHLVVIGVFRISLRQNVYLTDFQTIYFYVATVVISYMAAFGTSLLFEAPMMGLEKVLFKKS